MPISCLPGPHRSEARVALYFESPAGAIGQVQVQAVEVQLRHAVHHLLQHSGFEEVARYIHMQPTPRQLVPSAHTQQQQHQCHTVLEKVFHHHFFGRLEFSI